MCNPLDPTVLHGAECDRCGVEVRDADTLDDGLCFECLAELEAEEEAEDKAIAEANAAFDAEPIEYEGT